VSDGPTVVRRARAPRLEVELVRSRLAAKLYGVAPTPPRIGHYEILERIGFGAQGDVYLVHDPRLDRRLAIKVLRREVDEDGIAEARALAQVVHPNVVPVFDVGIAPAEGSDGARAYLVMEYVEGRSLQAWCEATSSWAERLRVLVDAGRGLLAAHAAGIVHGDFKPSNVVVGADGRPRVMDFGLARWVADATTTTSSSGSARGGTPGYRAPECDERGPDARSDQYSFCITAWRLLVEPSAMPPPVLARVRETLERGLRLPPAERWPDMAALLDRLVDAGRRRIRVAPLAVAAGALAIGGLFLFTPARDAPHAMGATALDFRGMSASALLRAGRLAWAEHREHEARAPLERAAHLAEACGDDRVSAQAAMMLVDLFGRRLAQFDDARRWEPHARAAVARLGDRELEAKLDLEWGTILALAGDPDAGRAVLLALRERTLGDPPIANVSTADVESALARLENDARRSADALRWAERAVASQAARVGTEHRAYADALLRLGVAQERHDDLVAARRSFEEVVAIHERSGADLANMVGARNSLAVVLERQGDLEGAARQYDLALRGATELGSQDAVVTLNINLGLLELARKDASAALEHIATARTFAESIYPADHAVFTSIHAARGMAHRLAGEDDRAVSAFESALSIATARHMEYGEIGRHRWHLGAARWDAGAKTQARAEVAQACVELAIDPALQAEHLAACREWLRVH
jgi:eukaryotic-like serine/threonine-protein kinase